MATIAYNYEYRGSHDGVGDSGSILRRPVRLGFLRYL